MEDSDKKLIEKFEADFHTLSSKEGWTKDDLEKMKDLQKLMYYMEVRCAMKDGEGYPGSQYMDERSSYGHGMPHRSSVTGRFTSGHGYPMGYSYGHMSGRRYYDSEHEKFMNDLNHMMAMETDPEIRNAMETVSRMLEMR